MLGDSYSDRRIPIGTMSLAARLDAHGGRSLSVVDEGISGNRVLSDAGTAGVSALARSIAMS